MGRGMLSKRVCVHSCYRVGERIGRLAYYPGLAFFRYSIPVSQTT